MLGAFEGMGASCGYDMLMVSWQTVPVLSAEIRRCTLHPEPSGSERQLWAVASLETLT